MSNIQPVLDILSEENEEKIAVMERILKHCEKGVSVCRRIITAFKIAAVSLVIFYFQMNISDQVWENVLGQKNLVDLSNPEFCSVYVVS